MPRFNGYEPEGTLLQGTSLFRNLIGQIEDLKALLMWLELNEIDTLSAEARWRITEALSDP